MSPSAHTDTFCRDNLPDPADWPEIVLGPDTSYPDRLNCATALLDDVIREHGGDRPCLLSPDGEEWSYEELRTTANRIANLLVEDLGLVPGNRVLLRGPNNPWTVACWFGVLKAGGVVVATMPLLRAGELAAVDEIARIDLSLCDHRFLDELQAAGTSAPVVAYGGSSADDLCQRIAEASAEHDDVVTAADDVALLAFTSGTTGRPKATMHFHRDVLAIADTFSRHVLQPTAEDRFTGTPPIAFTFGLGGAVVFPLRVGASTLLVEKATPAELAGHIETHGVTICFTAPTAYRAMVSGGHTGSLGSLRRAVSAGEHLDEATWRTFHEGTGIRIIDGIGSTEMLHVFIAAADDDIHPGSTGVEVPGYTARVVDEDGRTVPDGTPGRLAVKGPTGCRYLADPRQQVYVENGWNITGDTFVRDEEGYFWYRARNDDMIISSGYNIAGPEVEEAVLSHPDVSDCAVVGHPDPSRGQLVVAYVVLRDGAQAGPELAAAIQDHVKSRIAPYKYPRRVEFIDALPRTATGKLQRYRLRDQTV
ncbi:MAG: 2-aminobenzoate-CoA ligase [Kytococcus sp.]|nr:2-aminobenzoate-CoA ligase [Kytococcus sp.]